MSKRTFNIEGQMSFADIFPDEFPIKGESGSMPTKTTKKAAKPTASKTRPERKKTEAARAPKETGKRKPKLTEKETSKTKDVPAKGQSALALPNDTFFTAAVEAVKNAKLSPGARYRIESYVRNELTSNTAFSKTVREFEGVTYTSQNFSIQFKRGVILYTDTETDRKVMWVPVYTAIENLVAEGKWLTKRERAVEERANDEHKSRSWR